MFIVMLGHFRVFNNFWVCGQSCRGLQYLSMDAKNSVIAVIICEISSFQSDWFPVTKIWTVFDLSNF